MRVTRMKKRLRMVTCTPAVLLDWNAAIVASLPPSPLRQRFVISQIIRRTCPSKSSSSQSPANPQSIPSQSSVVQYHAVNPQSIVGHPPFSHAAVTQSILSHAPRQTSNAVAERREKSQKNGRHPADERPTGRGVGSVNAQSWSLGPTRLKKDAACPLERNGTIAHNRKGLRVVGTRFALGDCGLGLTAVFKRLTRRAEWIVVRTWRCGRVDWEGHRNAATRGVDWCVNVGLLKVGIG